jgi:hypothetical protein
MENLWPAFAKKEITTPRAVFEKQIEFFNSSDTGLRASLSRGLGRNGNLSYTFYIQAAALSGYTFELFTAFHHAGSIYPVVVNDAIKSAEYQAENQEQLEGCLKEIFNSQELKDIIQNLIAQIFDDSLKSNF